MEKSEVKRAIESEREAADRLIAVLNRVADYDLRSALVEAAFDYAKATQKTAFATARAITSNVLEGAL